MGYSEGKYNIKAISSMLGIQPGTLRAWERRYNMIAPIRNESGHRLYTEEHLKILRWLISKVNQGFTISQAVALMENSSPDEDVISIPRTDKSEELTDNLLNVLLEFNSAQAHELLNQAFSLYTVEKTVMDILGPLLIKVGDLWEEGKITTAHEHFASSFLRSRLEGLSTSFPHSSFLPKAIAVCGPGERHELGLLIFTLYLRRKGFEVIFLGTSLAEHDIEVVIEQVDPKFVFLSCTLEINKEGTLALADDLSEKYKDLFIGIGGIAFDAMTPEQKQKYKECIVGMTRMDWDNWLKVRLGTLK